MKGLKKVWKRPFGLTIAALLLGFSLPVIGSAQVTTQAGQDQLAEQVRHQLVMLPYYWVFDNLEFEIQDPDTVVISGEVTRPLLKSDAEKAVQRVKGVNKVVNNIEVLPLLSFDDSIRLRTYRAIYSTIGLDRYALRAVPPIHIIVNRGHVTLEGVVANESDKNLAGLRAQGVFGAFSVTNDLRIG